MTTANVWSDLAFKTNDSFLQFNLKMDSKAPTLGLQNKSSSRLVKRNTGNISHYFGLEDKDDEILTALEVEMDSMNPQMSNVNIGFNGQKQRQHWHQPQQQQFQRPQQHWQRQQHQVAMNNYGSGYYSYACRVPQLKNSEVTCWKWPNWQSCKQTCTYGHGISQQKGTVKSMMFSCRNSENNWKPHRMVDCQPYLNCKVRLTSPGDLKCVEPTNGPPSCDITCEEYDDRKSQKVKVVCDEKFGGMRLPHCATLDFQGRYF
ncbi:uncharacterized protein NPIL_557211 [Nephila pilipes]|uniref:Uncharacterized protein n=1 Tax=Nephila pilipes TaxID=299642 RepID=A0A8X6PC33_NEPPI|nr:uncharacterized protein NPIL_557211 [Nephila pilipes]